MVLLQLLKRGWVDTELFTLSARVVGVLPCRRRCRSGIPVDADDFGLDGISFWFSNQGLLSNPETPFTWVPGVPRKDDPLHDGEEARMQALAIGTGPLLV